MQQDSAIFVRYVATTVAIFLIATLGQIINAGWSYPSAVLLPAMGVGLAIMWIGGYRYLVPILLGLLLATWLPPYALPLPNAFAVPVVKIIGMVVGVTLLRWLHFTGTFLSIRDVLVYHASVVILGAVTAFFLTLTAILTGRLADPLYVFFGHTWGAHVFSCLVLTPAIIAWSLPAQNISRSFMRAEVGAAGALVGIMVYLLFWTDVLPQYTLLFFTGFFLAHFWVCLRFSHRMVVMTVLASSLLSITGLLLSTSPRNTLINDLFALELFFLAVIPIFYAFSSLVKERSITINELQLAKGNMERENVMKNEFIAVLAHELRNPLALVKTTLEILELERNDSAVKSDIVTARQHVHAMRRLLDDLLDISRITQGKFKLQLEQVELGALIKKAAVATQPLFSERQHTLVWNCGEVAEVVINVDPVRIEQVMVNLLTNAAKYTEPGGRIELSCTVTETVVKVQVRDNGQGIEPEHLLQVFDSFWQKNTYAGHSADGIGVGLSLTKRIVELHQGTITASSPGRNQGSTFTVTLPVFAVGKPRVPITTELPAPPPRHYTFLIVDDNKDAANALAKLLTMKGHVATTVYSATELYDALKTGTPEVILLDIGLADASGYDVAKQLRSEGYRGLLLALSGYGQKEDKDMAMASGFDHHFTKPMSAMQLEAYLAQRQR